MNNNFNSGSGNFDPKVNRSNFDQNKDNGKAEISKEDTQDPSLQASTFKEVDSSEILKFMAANSAINAGTLQQSTIENRILQFTSLISPEHYDKMFEQFRAVVDEELVGIGKNVSEGSRNDLVELSLSNHLIGTPRINEG